MKLLTAAQIKQLRANADKQATSGEGNFKPVVKFFNPCGAATWLLTELDSDNDTLFGIADLGMGFVEYGAVSLKELASLNVGFGLGIERDIHFEATKTLEEYYRESNDAGRINA